MLRLDFNLVWNIVNFIVLYLLLKRFLIKPVMAVMNQRQTMIDESISRARNTEKEANARKSQYEEKLSASAAEGEQLLTQVKAESRVLCDKMVQEAGAEADRIIENARRTAAMEQEKAMREAQAQIAGLVIAAATKVVGGEVNDKKNQSLFDKFIVEAGESHDAGSR